MDCQDEVVLNYLIESVSQSYPKRCHALFPINGRRVVESSTRQQQISQGTLCLLAESVILFRASTLSERTMSKQSKHTSCMLFVTKFVCFTPDYNLVDLQIRISLFSNPRFEFLFFLHHCPFNLELPFLPHSPSSRSNSHKIHDNSETICAPRTRH